MRLITILLALALTSGCYHARITTDNADPVTEGSETVHVLGWGLWQPSPVKATPCTSNNLDEVRVHSNLLFALATVATLGFYMPLTVEWRCAATETPVRDFE
jgi:hypothetical protein